MPLTEWSDEFSIGVAEIDRDHQRLLGLLNDLYDAVEAGVGHEVLGVVLDGLILYVSYHFAREEDLFAETNYPGHEQHRLQHRTLTDAVKEIHADFMAGAAESFPGEVLEFLKTWFYKHIMESDHAFGVYLNANASTGGADAAAAGDA